MWMTRSILRSPLYSSCHKFSLISIRNLSNETDCPEAEWDGMYQRGVPRTMEEMSVMLRKSIDSPPDARLLKVAIVGVPNCGKSTLINKLMGWRVCSVSSKVHTTKINARAVFNDCSTQLVFLDTPGLVTPKAVTKYGLDRTHLIDSEMSLQNADIMAVVHDMSNDYYKINALHPRVLRLLALYPTIPSILILNKLDVVKSKRRLLVATRFLTDGIVGGHKIHTIKEKPQKLDREKLLLKALSEDKLKHSIKPEEEKQHRCINTIENRKYKEEDVFEGQIHLTEQEVGEFIKDRRGWPKFQDVFMISSLKGLGVDDLRDYLFDKAYKAPWIFNSHVVTDQNPKEIALMAVREKFMDTFKGEIPYELRFEIEHWDLTETDLLNIGVRVSCKKEHLARHMIGPGGYHISDIAKAAEQELRNTFRAEVKLRINVVYDATLKKIKK